MKAVSVDKTRLQVLYCEQGLGIPEIARLLGAGKTTVQRRLHQYGIAVRSMSEAKMPHGWNGNCVECGEPSVGRSTCKSCGDKASYQKHRGARLKQAKDYRNNRMDKEARREYNREYAKNNPETVRRAKRKYSHNNTGAILRKRIRERLRSAMRQYSATGKCYPSRKYGINYMAIIDYLGPCPGSLQDWHIDHIFPLSAFDLNEQQEVRIANMPENHQWLRSSDNISKGASYSQSALDRFRERMVAKLSTQESG